MSYQSFGSYGSFKFTPDLGRSRKILQARSEEREGEDRYLNQLQQQQRSYMEVMRQKLRDEQNIRDSNFQLQSGFRQQYQDAVLRNDETNIANLEAQRRQSAEFLKSLSDFSQTLGKKFIDEAKKDEETKENNAHKAEVIRLNGMTPEQKRIEYGFMDVREATLSASDASVNAIANTQAPYVGNNAVEPTRRTAFGSLAVGLQRVKLNHYAANIEDIAAVNKDFKYTLYDPVTNEPLKLTLDEAKQRGGEIAAQGYKALINETVEQLGLNKGKDGKPNGISAEFLVRNFYDVANSYTNRALAASESALDEERGVMAEARQSSYMQQELYSAVVKPFDPRSRNTISALTARWAAENPGKYSNEKGLPDYAFIRDSIVLPEFQSQIESGVFDKNLDAVAHFLNEQALVLNTSGKPVPLQSIKSSESLNILNKTIKERQRTFEAEREQEEMSAAKEDVNRLMAAGLEDGVMTPSETNQIKQAMLYAYKSKPTILKEVTDIVDNFGVDDSANLDKESAFLELQKAGINGDLKALTVQQNMNWLSKDQREELLGYVDNFNSSDPSKEGYNRKDVEKDGLSIILLKLDKQDIGSVVHPSVNWAKTEIGDYYVDRFDQLKTEKPHLDVQARHVEARKDTVDYVTHGINDPSNPFYVVPADEADGTQGYVKYFSSGNYSIAQATNTQQQIKDINQNPNLLSTNVYLSNRYLADIEGDIKNGRMIEYTPWVNQIASMTNKLPYEVINQQLQAAKIDQKIEPGAFDKLVEVAEVSPKLKKLLAQPTAARINAAIIGTGNAPKTVRQGRDGEQDVMQLAHLSNFKAPPIAAAMWALETGRGATVHGSNALFNIKSKTGQGTTTSVKEFVNGRWVENVSTTFENYDTPLQSAQAYTEYINNIPGFTEAKTYRQAIQAITNAGYATDPQYADKVIGVLKDMGYNADDLIREYTGSPATNPNAMSPTLRTVFYRTGDVMAPGMAPSEHTDVKQMDNPNTPEDETNAYFEPDALEQYVEVTDAEYGKVGLEELTNLHYGKGNRPEDMKFFAPRKYRNGTHLGWDYPTANGSTLHLKGGARVVGGYQTEFGYKAIIEIPNGKRFSFLHGYKS